MVFPDRQFLSTILISGVKWKVQIGEISGITKSQGTLPGKLNEKLGLKALVSQAIIGLIVGEVRIDSQSKLYDLFGNSGIPGKEIVRNPRAERQEARPGHKAGIRPEVLADVLGGKKDPPMAGKMPDKKGGRLGVVVFLRRY